MTEYLIILAMVAISAILIIGLFGRQIKAAFTGSTAAIGGAINESNLLSQSRSKLSGSNKTVQHVTCFLSYAPEDASVIDSFRGQVISLGGNITLNDWLLRDPFDSGKARFIREGVRDSINRSSIVVILLSPSAADNPWVEWDAREAVTQGRKVVAVYLGDSPPKTLPKAVIEKHIPIFSWSPMLLIGQGSPPSSHD